MRYRILGKTGLKVSEVGCGGIPIQHVSKENVKELVDTLIKKGVNIIDSARGYTISEELIGYAIEGRRDKFYLATKSMSRSYDDMKRDIEKSLKNFRTDYIDLYQIHNIRDNNYEGCLKALREAKKEGKIGHIGITSHSVDFASFIIDKEDDIETIQIPYNFLELQATDLFEKAYKKNIGIIVMKPLAGGNIDNAKTSIKFILNNKYISTCIPGMENKMQVIENTSVNDFHITDEDITYMNNLKEELKEEFCHRCGYCMPCSVGIDIPSCFTYENYYKKYNLKEWAVSRYKAMIAKPNDCIKCGKCEARCPYNLHIIERLKRVNEVFKNE